MWVVVDEVSGIGPFDERFRRERRRTEDLVPCHEEETKEAEQAEVVHQAGVSLLAERVRLDPLHLVWLRELTWYVCCGVVDKRKRKKAHKGEELHLCPWIRDKLGRSAWKMSKSR